MLSTVEFMSTSGLTNYQQALEVMAQRVMDIQSGKARECIWFLEHSNIYTCGSSVKAYDIQSDIPYPVHKTGRGGQVTYHGPGQLIGYAMLDLNKRGRDIKKYIHNLELWIMQSLQQIGIRTIRRKDRVGLWVEVTPGYDEKIVALGVRVQKWVTSHGFAININPDLGAYKFITPCGIQGHGITSCYQQNIKITRNKLEKVLQHQFFQVFNQSDS